MLPLDPAYYNDPTFQTLLNAQGLYAATVLPAYIILAASVALAYLTAGGSLIRLKSCFKPVAATKPPTREPVAVPEAH